jgi:hypothetical protein
MKVMPWFDFFGESKISELGKQVYWVINRIALPG